MGPEPHVDAGTVEGVGALGEKPQGFSLLELPEADRAVGALHDPLLLDELNLSEGPDQRLLQPATGWRVIPVEAECIGGIAAAPLPPEGVEPAAVPGDDGVVEDEHEDTGQDADDDDEERREAGVVGGVSEAESRRRRRQRRLLEDEAPLGAVTTAEPLGAVSERFGWETTGPVVLGRRHGRGRGDLSPLCYPHGLLLLCLLSSAPEKVGRDAEHAPEEDGPPFEEDL